mmetsp:Transcript_3198/g.3822  ORF Transcript_3198/g.3822 Transcript_3198/m.3822 type:complete len:158 (+) Transcript_3198:239-712(+)
MNKVGVTEGAIDAKRQSEIRKTKNMKVSTEPKHKAGKVKLPDDMIYGMMNRPSTPIEGVISNTYGIFAEQEAEEIYKHSTVKPNPKQKAAAVRTNKAHQKLMELQKTKKENMEVVKSENFKIKRFTKVESRVKAQLKKNKPAPAAPAALAAPEEAKE